VEKCVGIFLRIGGVLILDIDKRYLEVTVWVKILVLFVELNKD
jgi:hypothetical protein